MFVMTVYWQDLTGNVTDVTWQTVCFRISDSHLCELKFNNFESVLCEMRSGTPVIIFHAHANQRLTDMAFSNDLPHLAHQIANANTNLILWVDKKANREKKTEAERERGENSSLERQFKQIFWSVNGIVWFKRGSSLHNLKRAFDAIESQSGGNTQFFFLLSFSRAISPKAITKCHFHWFSVLILYDDHFTTFFSPSTSLYPSFLFPSSVCLCICTRYIIKWNWVGTNYGNSETYFQRNWIIEKPKPTRFSSLELFILPQRLTHNRQAYFKREKSDERCKLNV